MYYVHKCVSFV